jgi:hypothetical protein
MAVLGELQHAHGDPAYGVAFVAQEAGDHPESCAERMQWALATVSRAYGYASVGARRAAA